MAKHQYLLGVLHLRSEHLDTAEKAARKALALAGSDAPHHQLLSDIMTRAGRPGDAAEAARHTIALKPENTRYRHNLVNILEAAGLSSEAYRAMDEAVALYVGAMLPNSRERNERRAIRRYCVDTDLSAIPGQALDDLVSALTWIAAGQWQADLERAMREKTSTKTDKFWPLGERLAVARKVPVARSKIGRAHV